MSSSVEYAFNSFNSAVFSPSGDYLAISDRNGVISVHKLSHVARQAGTNSNLGTDRVVKMKPFVTISDSNASTAAHLLLWRDYLLCCFSNGQVDAYLWSDIAKQRVTTAWSKRFFDSTKQASSIGTEFETWITIVDTSGRDLLLAGAASTGSTESKCPVYCWEFESSKLLNTYSGHSSSVYCLSSGNKENDGIVSEFLSAGEDGDVRLWDLRSSTTSEAVLKPFTSNCARPGFGRWIGCLAVEGEWAVCGGGPQLGLWHVGSRSLVKPMTVNGSELAEHYCGIVVEDRIITSGSGGKVLHWNYRGDSISVMPASSNIVYDLQYNSAADQQILSAVGTGPLIDLYSRLVYRMAPIQTIY